MIDLRTGVRWYGDRFARQLKAHRGSALADAAKFFRDAIRTNITQFAGSYVPPKHSPPGAYPFYITRELANSIEALVTRAALHAMVYSDLPYARYLEFGTTRMAPRPFFRRTLFVRAGQIARIMCRPMP